MKLIVGIGNPGKKYDGTRHNIGFEIVDKFVENENFKDKFNALYVKKNIDGVEVIFIKPQTYVNLSGDSVIKFVNYYNIEVEDILVIQDDLDMVIGSYKLKKLTSSGGHNGIKSIESVLKSQEFARLKIGILNDKKNNIIDFVLGRFSSNEVEIMNTIDTNKIIKMFIVEGFDKTINKYKV